MVALGILLSRVVGLVRTRIFGHFLGTGEVADAFTAAFRIPNILQNLLGEGALSASFIPVYAGLLNRGDPAMARQVARAVASLIALVVALLSLAGIAAAPWLVDTIAGGFEGRTRDLTVQLIRILFPGAGLLVFSAWCLGILNSHRRFFLSYAAPVAWNAAMIAALVGWGPRRDAAALVLIVAWGSVAGSALQVLVQLPTVLRVLGGLFGALDGARAHVATVLRNFGPAVLSRGVVQVSAYVDTLIASFLPAGAMAAIGYAQTLYNLPVSLFGMSVSAAELPEMAGGEAHADTARCEYLRERLRRGLRQIAFFVIPTMWGFILLGNVLVAAIYETGAFTRRDTNYVWAIMAAAALGLLASTLGRLYASTFYALQDTRTPSRFALVRVACNVGLGAAAALLLPGALGIAPRWGAAGLTLAASACAWLEYALLRRAITRRIGAIAPDRRYVAKLWLAAALAGAFGWGLLSLTADWPAIPLAVFIVGLYALFYFSIGNALEVPEARAFTDRLLGRLLGARR